MVTYVKHIPFLLAKPRNMTSSFRLRSDIDISVKIANCKNTMVQEATNNVSISTNYR